jgi:hypothetical protein
MGGLNLLPCYDAFFGGVVLKIDLESLTDAMVRAVVRMSSNKIAENLSLVEAVQNTRAADPG